MYLYIPLGIVYLFCVLFVGGFLVAVYFVVLKIRETLEFLKVLSCKGD